MKRMIFLLVSILFSLIYAQAQTTDTLTHKEKAASWETHQNTTNQTPYPTGEFPNEKEQVTHTPQPSPATTTESSKIKSGKTIRKVQTTPATSTIKMKQASTSRKAGTKRKSTTLTTIQ